MIFFGIGFVVGALTAALINAGITMWLGMKK
jgi:hypothetical protein